MILFASNILLFPNADSLWRWVLGAFASVVCLVLVLMVLYVWREAWPALAGGSWNASFSIFNPFTPWLPLEGKLGLLPMAAGTLVCALGAVLLALPLGVASALFAQYFGHPFLVRPYRWVLGLLAGIPSVVFGFWGLTVLVPLIAAWQAPGTSVLAGIVVLTLMIVPTMALTAEAAFMAVPVATVQGAHALGLRPSRVVFGVLLPAARKGLMAGVVLCAARALGETMAVLMVTGNVPAWPSSLFDPVRTLTANIALEMAYAMGSHRASLFLSGLLLTVVVVLLAWVTHRQGTQAGVVDIPLKSS